MCNSESTPRAGDEAGERTAIASMEEGFQKVTNCLWADSLGVSVVMQPTVKGSE